MKTTLIALASLLLVPAAFSQIVPAGVTGTGLFNNNPSLLIDGVIPAETTPWTDSQNVWWQWQNSLPAFTIDLGADFNLTGILWSVDNNDIYRLQTSLDNVTFTPLFFVLPSDGAISEQTGGMDTMTSFAGSDFVANMAFSPVDARYLRVYAESGDGLYAIGEVQAFGDPLNVGAVPEPSTYGVVGVIALAGVVLLRRRKTRA